MHGPKADTFPSSGFAQLASDDSSGALWRSRRVLLVTDPVRRVTTRQVSRGISTFSDETVCSLHDACQALIKQTFEIVIVLPQAGAQMDEAGLKILRTLSGDAPVLVLCETVAPLAECRSATSMTKIFRSASGTETPPTVSVGPVVGHCDIGIITVAGAPLNLSATLSRILWLLLKAPYHSCSGTELVKVLSHPGLEKAPQTLRVHMHHLRRKLAAAGAPGVLWSGSGRYWLHAANEPALNAQSTQLLTA